MPITDPFQQQHDRQGEEAFKKIFERADKGKQLGDLLQQRIMWHLFGWGMVETLWRYSKTGLLLYVIPASVGVFGVGVGFIVGNAFHGIPSGLFYLYGILSLCIVAASMAYGYYKAPRIGRLIANAYFVCVGVFWIDGWLSRLAMLSGNDSRGIYRLIAFLSILGMLICFLSTVATEVWGMFHNRRQPME